MDKATIITAIITSGVAFITVLITATVTIITNVKSRKNEHKLSILKILLDAGYKSYELRTNQALEEAKIEGKKPTNMLSFTEYIIFYRKMAEVFAQDKVTEKDITNALEQNKRLIDTYYQDREVFRPDYHKKQEKVGRHK